MRSFAILLAFIFAAQVSAKTEHASVKTKAHADKKEEAEVKAEEKSSCETPAENKEATAQ